MGGPCERVVHGGIDRFEPSFFHHRLEDSCVQKLRLLHQSVDENGVRIHQVLLDKADHHPRACHIHFFFQIEPIVRRFVPQLARFAWFSGLIATNLPFISYVQAERGIDVCLQSPWHVVEDALVTDLARSQFPHAWDVLHSVRHLVPYSEKFVRSRILGGLYWAVVNDQRVEFDHFLVVLQ